MACFVDAVFHTVEQGMSITMVVQLAIIQQRVLLLWLQAEYVCTVRDGARHVLGEEICFYLLMLGRRCPCRKICLKIEYEQAGTELCQARLELEIKLEMWLVGNLSRRPKIKLCDKF